MDRFDHLYLTIAKEAGGIEGLLNSFFSFLHRRTDFFYEADPNDKMGFPPGVNQQILFTIFKQYQEEYYKKVPKKSVEDYKAKLEVLKAKQQDVKTEPVTPTPVQNTQEIKKPVEDVKLKPPKQDPIKPPKETNDAVKVENKPQIGDKYKEDQYKDIR